jgi:hypothetical protein
MKPGEIRWGRSSMNQDMLLQKHPLGEVSQMIGMVVQRGDKWGIRVRRQDVDETRYSAAFGEDITLNFDTKEEARRYLWVTAHMRD